MEVLIRRLALTPGKVLLQAGRPFRFPFQACKKSGAFKFQASSLGQRGQVCRGNSFAAATCGYPLAVEALLSQIPQIDPLTEGTSQHTSLEVQKPRNAAF